MLNLFLCNTVELEVQNAESTSIITQYNFLISVTSLVLASSSH